MVENPAGDSLEAKSSLIQSAVRGVSVLTALGGYATLFFLVNIPSEISSTNIFRISGLRLAIFLGILIISLSASSFFIYSRKKPDRYIRIVDRFIGTFTPQKQWTISTALSLLLFLIGCFFISLTPEIQEPFTRAYFDRLMPAVILLTFVIAQALFLLLLVRYGSKPFIWLPRSKSFYISLGIFTAFYLGWIFIARAQLPTETRITGWNIASAPILDTQLFIAWIAGIVFIFAWHLLLDKCPDISRKRLSIIKRIDLLIFPLIWISSVIIWLRVPIQSNWFVSELTQPNLEFYPTSDARVYDITAQTALVGEGYQFFETPFIRRPLHAAYLTVLHLVAGQDYESVVSLQVLILALLPPFIYLLTSSLHDRTAGVIAAMLVMLREANSIAISGRITTSHAKELLVDLPTTLGIVIFTYVVMRWFKEFNHRRDFALIAGGTLGAVLLIRFEMILGFMVIAVVAYIVAKQAGGFRIWVRAILLFIFGLSIVILPWIYRNWALSGMIYLDSPLWRADLIHQRFQTIPELSLSNITPGAVETSTATGALVTPIPASSTPIKTPTQPGLLTTPIPTITTFEGESRRALQFMISHPGQVGRYIVTHYLNSQMQSLLILPSTFRIFDSTTAFIGHRSPERFWHSCCSAVEYIRRMPYWRQWDGSIPTQAIVPITINLLLIASGISVTWNKHRWIGMIPALIGVGHFLLNAFFRNSGGRYILPVDWVGVVYFSIGLSTLSTRFFGKFLDSTGIENWNKDQQSHSQNVSSSSDRKRRPVLFLFAGFLLLLGLSIPVIEIAFKPFDMDDRHQQMINTFYQSAAFSAEEKEFLRQFAEQGGEFVSGRALYPEYLPAHTTDVAKYKYLPAHYPRLSFYLVGSNSMIILMPIKNRPKYFPNASDVVVLGCPVVNTSQGNRRVDALLVGVLGPSGTLETIINRFPQLSTPQCPLPAPGSPVQGNGE
ncbi:MAG: hypothetical protein A2Z16_05135 [Chloroflexi bacterium RBG_16_54_18]|nr:MAG: hypothetical protein A2Z16_05135 [Chloroflexi bacterium RBG_16_54_18]